MTPSRPDVAARRAQLLDAAASVFSEHGITAPLDLVVERAALGRATLYRHFPDRTALVSGLMGRAAERLEAQARDVAGDPDGLLALLQTIADGIVQSPALVDYWRGANRDDPTLMAARARVLAAFAPAVALAIAHGRCRPDLTAEDVALASGMLGAALRGRSAGERQRLGERAMQLLWQGLARREDPLAPPDATGAHSGTTWLPAADRRDPTVPSATPNSPGTQPSLPTRSTRPAPVSSARGSGRAGSAERASSPPTATPGAPARRTTARRRAD